MANKIRGKLLVIEPTTHFTTSNGNPFSRRNFVLDCTWIDPYTGERGVENTPQFEVIQDKCNQLDALNVGDLVEVEFYIDGRKYTNKTTGKTSYITNVKATQITKAEYQSRQQQAATPVTQQATTPQQSFIPPQPSAQQQPVQQRVQTADDLPF